MTIDDLYKEFKDFEENVEQILPGSEFEVHVLDTVVTFMNGEMNYSDSEESESDF